MATVAPLDEVTTRVLAANPSPMTLDGTNTHVVAPPGSGVALVVDPGPDDPDHLAAVEQALDDAGARPVAVVATHRHVDHAAAATPWARRWGCEVRAADPAVADGGRTLSDGDRLDLPGLRVDVIATPGHTSDHLALRLGTGGLLTGDHVLGRGTTVVADPDGDLVAYLASLRRVLATRADALYPGHGPVLRDDPEAVVRFYLEHREYRLDQVLAVIGAESVTVDQIVATIYADHDRAVWPAAAASTRAALRLLRDRGQVVTQGEPLRARRVA
jgi:glyoxylase-like metal-dependent hydrolase (beta-lactamase superfamily II)